MPAEISWYKPHRVVFVRITGTVTLEEVAVMNKTLLQHLRGNRASRDGLPSTLAEYVHVIFNVVGEAAVPVSISQLSKIVEFTREPNLGWVVVVGANSFLRFVAATLTQLAQARMRALDTMAQARTFLAEIDDSLADLPVLQAPDEGQG